jgi:PAS domain S-box-containing protein
MAGTIETIDILHVDDESGFTDLAATLLEREDERFDVDTATCASDGLTSLETSTYDCVISDHDMPGQNGIEFLEGVREEYPDLPFVLYTGKGSEEVASDAISAGVTDYLQKQSGTSQYAVLANRIRNAVDKYNAQTELADREKRLNLFFEQAPLGVVEWDEEFNFVRLNEAAERILGYSEADLIGRSWEVIVPESDHGPVDDVVSGLLEDSGGYRSANENIRKNGDRIVCEWHNRVVTDDSGDVVAIFSQFEDITEADERKAELQRSERRYAAVFNDPNILVGLLDTDGTVLDVNQTAMDYIGPTPDEITGEQIWETPWFDHSEAVQQEIKAWTARAADGEYIDFKTDLTRPDDESYTVEGAFRPVLNDDGEVVSLFVSGRDISERKEQQHKRQQIIDRVTDAIVEVDANWGFSLVNEQAEALCNMAEGELLGRNLWEVFDEALDTRFERKYRRVMETREPTSFVEYFSQLDAWFDVEVYPKADGGLAFYFIEVTEQREREQQLEALNRVTQELMGADTRDEVVEIGVKTARDLLGMDVNAIHLYDEDVDALVPAVATDATYDLINEPPSFTGDGSLAWRVYQRGEALAVDDVYEESDRYNPETPVRSELYLPVGEHGILIAGSPLPETFDEQDVLLGKILASGVETALEQVERTEKLRTRERELTEQNSRLEQFASIVSHDLRNPLSVAEGRLDLAAAECDSEHLEHIEQAHDRMEKLIEELLTVAHEGEAVTDTEPVVLDSLVERCWATVETGEATLVSDSEHTVQADRSRLKQLFENLIGNAVEHADGSVAVTVGALADGFYLEDDGPGIPAAEREPIFEAGYSTREDGTGFGLNIVEQIVDAHG